MPFQLQMIGTGSAFAKKYNNNNALIRAGEFTLLVDCGVTAPRALDQLGLEPNKINAVLITHLHADHVGGLEELAFRSKFTYAIKPHLYIARQLVQPLWENSLKAGLEQPADGLNQLESYFEVHPLDEGEAVTLHPGLDLEMLQTQHIPGKASFSLIFNGKLFYSSDMIFQPELLQHLVEQRGVETIFHDCQLEESGAVHATLAQLLTLDEGIRSRINLMHYGDQMEQYIGRTDAMQFVRQQQIYTYPY